MKKIISLMLVLIMMLSFAACSNNSGYAGSNDETTAATGGAETTVPQDTEAETTVPEETAAPEVPCTFTFNGTKIAMNAPAADIIAALGEPKNYTEETSCAFEGLDKTYFFGSFYLQTYPVDGEDFIYSLWLVDDSVTTEEGLYIGATEAEVLSIYGTDARGEGNAYFIEKGDCRVTIILEEGVVTSIQYDAILE